MSTRTFVTKSNGALVVALALILAFAVPANFGAHAAVTKRLNFSANGQTISVAKGTSVRVTLGASNWQLVQKSKISSMKTTVGIASSGEGCTVMGNTCGTTTFSFKLKTAGKAYFMAERLTAGEAMRCVTDCTFKVTFKVK
jgi:hypothetical protein